MSRITSKAPGRICLFGDHQDYLGLPIIACAIDRFITIEGEKNDKNKFVISMPDTGEELLLDLDYATAIVEKGAHLKAALKVLRTCLPDRQEYDCIATQGYTLKITGDIPINAGLSSSSALVVAWVQWLLQTFGISKEITPELIGQIAYEAEVVEQNSPGGKMDQYTSAIGGIIYLETGENTRVEKIGTQIEGLIIAPSGVPKNTIGLLGDLKGNALKAIAIVKKNVPAFNLEKATLKDFKSYKNLLPADLQDYFYAAIKNHLITQKALTEFKKESPDLKSIGNLMNAHHAVLKDQLKITVPQIDRMIDAAINAGAYGAKIVGSGGGGSIAVIAPPHKEAAVITALKNCGAKEAAKVNVTVGAHTEK